MKKRNRQLGHIERDMLEKLSLGDLLYGFLLSARSTRLMYRRAHQRAAERYRRKTAIQRLIERNYIIRRGKRLTITSSGRNSLGIQIKKNLELLGAKTWDHKWRIAIFDIPESISAMRDKVRRILKKAGFVKLQQSVWVFPHDCDELVQLIKSESGLSDYILYGTLDHIEGDSKLRKLFGLSS